jgi:hypothetical protein
MCSIGDRGKHPGRADRSCLGAPDRLCQSEVQYLHRAIGSDLDVRRLQIAVDDAVIVGGFERVGDLAGDGEHLVQRERPAGNARGELFAVDQLHHER